MLASFCADKQVFNWVYLNARFLPFSWSQLRICHLAISLFSLFTPVRLTTGVCVCHDTAYIRPHCIIPHVAVLASDHRPHWHQRDDLRWGRHSMLCRKGF